MTIKVKLFLGYVDETFNGGGGSVKQMEENMNNFLKDLDDNDVKKIYIALGPTQRMGLVEYKEKKLLEL